MKAALALVCAATALASGLAGCDGSSGPLSKSQYEAKMSALGHDFTSRNLDFNATDFSGVRGYFSALSTRLRDVVTQLKAIEPPRGVAGVHARIVDGFEREAALAKSFADELAGADPGTVESRLRQFDSTRFRAAYREIDAAAKELAARGYKISSSGGT